MKNSKIKISTIERAICSQIRFVEDDIRKKYPWLKYQDAIAVVIFVLSVMTIAISWGIYLICSAKSYSFIILIIFIIAFATSILHELEHDLIHNMYFKSNIEMQNIMFTVIWFAKLHGHPWFRKDLHLKHHLISGQIDDAEERLIGLGLPLGWKRLIITAHPMGMPIVTESIEKDCLWFRAGKMNWTSLPTAFLFFFLFKSLLVFLLIRQFFPSLLTFFPIPSWCTEYLWHLNILWIFPNILRQSCLHLMSNATHYYGDIPAKSLFYQNQILDHPLVFPFQMLCCNFGATHIIHHYVPNQPFYIRELVYRKVKDYMVENGVRNNDLGILIRGNRYFANSDDAKLAEVVLEATPPLPQTYLSALLQSIFSVKKLPEYSFLLWCIIVPTIGYPSLVVSDSVVSYFVLTWYLHALKRKDKRDKGK